MTTIDIIFVIITALSIFSGYRSGVISVILSLFVWLAAILIAHAYKIIYYDSVAGFNMIYYAAIFTISFNILYFIIRILSIVVKCDFKHWLNYVPGMIFGAGRGLLIIMIFNLVFVPLINNYAPQINDYLDINPSAILPYIQTYQAKLESLLTYIITFLGQADINTTKIMANSYFLCVV